AERVRLGAVADLSSLADVLLARRLISPYQADRVRAGAGNGLVLRHYRVLDKIGSGGMGTVFKAEHQRFRTPVAVKALLVDGSKFRRAVDRFFREVRAVAYLKHPNVVAAIDAGEEP